MTAREMYRECERLYKQVDWSNKESIHRYNEKVRELRRLREEETEKSYEVTDVTQNLYALYREKIFLRKKRKYLFSRERKR